MSTYTPWGVAQSVRRIRRGIRQVSTAGHGGVMVSKRLAEKFLPKTVLARSIKYGNTYCFEEDCEWRWVAVCLCPELSSFSYEELLFETAGMAVRYDEQDVFVSACLMAGVGEASARKYMKEYIQTEVVESVRRGVLELADEYERTGKLQWVEPLNTFIVDVANLFRAEGVTAASPREEIYSVGLNLLSGKMSEAYSKFVNNGGFSYDVRHFCPVYYFTAA